MSDFRAYFPRFLAIFRAYFPRPGLPRKAFAPISPGLLGLKWHSQRLSRLFPLACENFRAYFPRPIAPFADLSRLFPPVFKSQ